MKKLVGILSAMMLLVAGSAFAGQKQAQGEQLLQQCNQEAQKAGVQASDKEVFIDNCLNDKIGYERTVKGQDNSGGE